MPRRSIRCVDPQNQACARLAAVLQLFGVGGMYVKRNIMVRSLHVSLVTCTCTVHADEETVVGEHLSEAYSAPTAASAIGIHTLRDFRSLSILQLAEASGSGSNALVADVGCLLPLGLVVVAA